jgi:hypothetical protein
MKLAFNSLNSGLGNNGGSRTIILCAAMLENLGHDCSILATVDNFTWFPHKQVKRHIPRDLDAIIAVACTDVDYTVQMNVPRKAWYIRGHEVWTMPEEELSKRYNAGLFNIVNSSGLQDKLKSLGADSVVVYQGVDVDFWRDMYLRSEEKIRIGCLYNRKPTKRWGDFVKLANILGTDDYDYIGIGDTMRNDDFLTFFWANASKHQLLDIYSSCHIWFAPTELEGMHNVPMEASLCGCAIVCSDHEMNGMLDYSFDGHTTTVYESRNIEQASAAIQTIDWTITDRLQKMILDKIGDRRVNMIKMIQYLERL